MTPDPASDPRRAFALATIPDELRAGLLALADQHEAEAAQADAGQGAPDARIRDRPNQGTSRA